MWGQLLGEGGRSSPGGTWNSPHDSAKPELFRMIVLYNPDSNVVVLKITPECSGSLSSSPHLKGALSLSFWLCFFESTQLAPCTRRSSGHFTKASSFSDSKGRVMILILQVTEPELGELRGLAPRSHSSYMEEHDPKHFSAVFLFCAETLSALRKFQLWSW